jgi:hypothetical protein
LPAYQIIQNIQPAQRLTSQRYPTENVIVKRKVIYLISVEAKFVETHKEGQKEML